MKKENKKTANAKYGNERNNKSLNELVRAKTK